MKTFHLSVAVGVRQQPKKRTYAQEVEISSLDEFRQAVQWDNVGAILKEHHRSNDNFISTDVIMMDCDNESDNPIDWLTPDKLAERISNVPFFIAYSRNHLKDKSDKSARPRWHIYLPLSETCSDVKRIRAMKEKLLRVVPEFDSGAKDAARLFYGVDNPQCEAHEGEICINDFLDTIPDFMQDARHDRENDKYTEHDVADSEAIPVHERNSTLFQVAMQNLGKYGISEKARKIFDNACSRCQPPLSISEVAQIWISATKYAQNFKEKYTPKKSTLTLPVIEKTLQEFNIDVRFDVISHRLTISDLPVDNPYIPDSYSTVDGFTRKETNKKMLPLFLRAYLKDNNFTFASDFIYDSLDVIALTHSYNPFFEMIKNTTWDGKNRIYELCQILGITSENFHYIRFFEKWLWQVVSMSLNDDGALGNAFVLVLQGPQGIGKTSIFKKLAVRPEWFKEGASIDMNNKDTIIEATSVLICELGELEGTLNREQVALKNFITRNFDEYRPPYGKASVNYVRRTALCGTVNSEQFLRDVTGNRRFVVIPVTEIDKDFIFHVMTPDYCAQLWRQVYEQYYLKRGRNGFYLSDDERAFSEGNNAQAIAYVDGEIELYETFDWEQPLSVWKWYNSKEILTAMDSKMPAKKLGKALTAAKKKDTRIQQKHKEHGEIYLLPPKNNKLYS